MWRYRLPDYEQRLLGQLQRQQHRGLCCDTMLQTDGERGVGGTYREGGTKVFLSWEGVTVPVHGCILEALRPCLSQTTSASPSPHFVHLPTVRPQILLKLVSFLYSGHLEGEGERELEEVMAAACHLGLSHLVERWKEKGTKGEDEQRQFREAAMQADVEERRVREVDVQTMETATDGNSPVEGRSSVDSGTQTVDSDTLAGLLIPSHKAPFSNSFCDVGPPVMSPQNISLPQHLAPCSSIPADQSAVGFRSPTPSRNPCLDFEPRAYCIFNVTKPTSSPNRSVTPNNESTNPVSQEDLANPENLAAKEHIENELHPRRKLEKKGGTESLDHSLPTTGGIEENELRESKREEMVRDNEVGEEERRKSRKGRKSMSRVRQMEATETRISIKVKLRRKTRGQVWQVVSLQETTRSPQRQHPAHDPTPAPPYQVHNPSGNPADPQLNVDTVEESDEQIEKLLEDIMMGLNILPPIVTERDYEHQSPHQDRELACERPNENTAPHRTQGSVVATTSVCSHGNGTGGDEKFSEMAFHSIPSSSSFVPSSTNPAPPDPHPYVQPQPLTAFCHCSHHASTPFQHPNANPHQPHCCHSNWAEHDHVSCYAGSQSSSEHCCQNQARGRHVSVQSAPTRPGCQQCQQCRRDTGQGDAGRMQGGPPKNVLSQSTREKVFNLSMECPSANVEETMPRPTSTNQDWVRDDTTRAGLPPSITVHSESACGHKHHHRACQGATPLKELHFPELSVPMSPGSENHSFKTIAIPTWEDLRLPRCISPIDSEPPSSSVFNHQSPFHHPTPPPHVHRAPQPSLRWPPWLSQFPRELQYPLICMVRPSEICPTTLQDPEYSCRLKKCMSRPSSSSISNRTCTGNWLRSTTPDSKPKGRNARKKTTNAKTSKGVQLKSEKLKDEPGKGQRNRVHDGPNTKRKSQELTEPRFKKRRVEESDVTFLSCDTGENRIKAPSHVNMSVCSVSLSTNNILVKGNNRGRRYASHKGTNSGPETKPPIVQQVMDVIVPKRKRGRPRKIRHGDQEVPQPACSGPIIRGRKRKDVEHQGTRDKSAKTLVKPNRKYRNGEKSVKVEEHNMSSAGDGAEETWSSPRGFGQISSLLKPATEVAEGFRTEPRSESQSCMGRLQISSRPELGGAQIQTKTPRRSQVEVGVMAEDKTTTIKRPPTVNLKKFQELLKHRHPKTRKTDQEKNKQVRESNNDVGTMEEEAVVVKRREKCNGKESTERIFQSLDGSQTENINATDENHNEIVRPAKSSNQSEDKTSATGKEKRLREERVTVTGVLENHKGMMALPLEMTMPTVERTIMEDPRRVPMKHNEEYGENTDPKIKTRPLLILSEPKMMKSGQPAMAFRREREKRRLLDEDGCVTEKATKGSVEVDISSEELDVVGSIQQMFTCNAIVEVSEEEEIDVGIDEFSLEKEHPSTQPHVAACAAAVSIRREDTEGFKAPVGCLTPNHIGLSPKNKMTLPDIEAQIKENPSFKNSCMVSPGSTGRSDQEEVEVDILVCSPCAQPIVWEERITVPEFTTEEDIEEEDNEIDVIGYQTD